MKEALELSRTTGAMMHHTMEMAEAGQLVHEPAVDQKADEGEEQRLAQRRAPPVRRSGVENGAGYSADSEKGGKDGDDDGSTANEAFSMTVHESVMHSRGQTAPFGTIWLRLYGTPTEARTTGVIALQRSPIVRRRRMSGFSILRATDAVLSIVSKRVIRRRWFL